MKKFWIKTMSIAAILTLSVTSSAFADSTLTIEPELISIEQELGYEEIVEKIIQDYGLDAEISPQWTSGDASENYLTHGFLTEKGLNALKARNSQVSNIITATYANKLKASSVLPDIDETNLVFAWHFYGPNGKNYLGSTPTAYTKFRDHYNEAVDLYPTNTLGAMEELGRALHYLQDICEPHHAMNRTAIDSYHSEFEGYCEINRNAHAISTVSTTKLTTCNNSTLKQIADTAAEYARGYFDYADEDGGWATAIGPTLTNSQTTTAAVIYKFLNDVEAI